jgi:hypothetical protein
VKGFVALRAFRRLRAAQIRVAAWWRGMTTRRILHAKHKARVLLSYVGVAFRAKRTDVRRLYRHRWAIVRLQSFARFILALNRLEKLLLAIAKCQAFLGGRIGRRAFLRLRGAGLRVQASRWMVAAKRRFGAQRKAARRIQGGWRGYCGRNRVRLMQRSSKVIGKWWRTLLVVRQTRHYCMLMRNFNSWLTKPSYLGATAVAIQKVWRGYRAATRYQLKLEAAVKIQAFWRGAQVPTRSRSGAFNVRYLFARPRVVVEDLDGRLTKLAPHGSQVPGPTHFIVDLPKLSSRQRRLLSQYLRCLLEFRGFTHHETVTVSFNHSQPLTYRPFMSNIPTS